MKSKLYRHTKRRYQKLAAALASAAVLATAVIPGLAGHIHAAADPNPTGDSATPHVAHLDSTPQLSPIAASNSSPEANAKQVLDIKATAYAPGPHDNDQWGNKTFLGTQVRPGIIAVDPNVIPLGSNVMIKYPDGTKEYAVAEDTGGAIKGNRIDVAKWSVKEAEKFGIKRVKVYVLKDNPQEAAAPKFQA